MLESRGLILPVVLLAAACAGPAAPPVAREPPVARGQLAVAREPLVITHDMVLETTRTYGPIVIAASGITLDGNGAVIEGTVGGAPRDFTGTGIDARGVSGVTLRNVTVRGFRIGLRVRDAAHWTITDSDFSDNFHDPDFGWGEQEPGGGIALTDVRDFTLRDLVANRNWDACSLTRCNDGTIEFNDFSRASNTCLKLWNSSRHQVRDNNLSWGLRIAPGETHARDSTCVLIESGSDDNRFLRNDATHGGDGIFIRVLNGWTSRRNVFEANDVSYANNNGFEAWSPENTYVRNVANHCSYGFWLGASDRTTLIGNEAGWNGQPDGFHNAPEAFGHGGIVFVNGPSSHTRAIDNHCHDNVGGGIVLRGDVATQGAAWKAFHWVLEDNLLERNRWGLFIQHADWIDLRANVFAGNTEADVFDAGGVTNLVERDRTLRRSPDVVLMLDGPRRPVRVGERVRLAARTSYFPSPSGPPSGPPDGPVDEPGPPLACRWDLGDGTVASGPEFEHAWSRPGLQRVGVTVDNGLNAVPGSLDVFVVDDAPELDTGPAGPAGTVADNQGTLAPEGAAAWRLVDETGTGRAAFTDDADALVGGGSVHARIEPYDGGRAGLLYPASRTLGLPLAGRSVLRVWLKVRNPNIPAWQGANPVITLFESDSRWRRLTPDRDWLGSPAQLEARDQWNLIEVPLSGDAHWQVEDGPAGSAPGTLNWLVIGVDSWGWPSLDVQVDGLVIR